jgi:hypothetical protein
MKPNQEIEKQTSRIADAIVELVEGADVFVLLTQIDREISGFAKKTAPSWSKTINHKDRELLLWDGMTEAGAAALGHVIFGGKVAIQAVEAPLYLVDECVLENENWWPIALLPARAATLHARNNVLMRVSSKFLDYYVERTAAEGLSGYRLLTPSSVASTADRFSFG